jgi:HEAT repeat protein
MWRGLILLVVGLAAPSASGAYPAPMSREPSLKDEEVIVKLVESLADIDAEVRYNIATALANMGQRTVPYLIEALKSESVERRAGAAQALSMVRPSARSAVPELLKAMKDDSEMVRRQVSYALSRIVGRDAPPAPPIPIAPPPDPTPTVTNAGGAR